MQQIVIELNGTPSEEESGKGPGEFSKQLQEKQPDMGLLSDTFGTQCGLIIANYRFYCNDFLQHRKAALLLASDLNCKHPVWRNSNYNHNIPLVNVTTYWMFRFVRMADCQRYNFL
jgi:hypothetical protein